jgi:hypothetical protein
LDDPNRRFGRSCPFFFQRKKNKTKFFWKEENPERSIFDLGRRAGSPSPTFYPKLLSEPKVWIIQKNFVFLEGTGDRAGPKKNQKIKKKF